LIQLFKNELECYQPEVFLGTPYAHNLTWVLSNFILCYPISQVPSPIQISYAWVPEKPQPTPNMREKEVLNILDVLYDTALERDSWSNVLKALAVPVDGVTGHLLNWDKKSGLVSHFETFGVDNSAMESYASHWVLEDPRAAHHLQNPQVRFFSDEMFVSAREKKRLAFFNDWEHPLTAERYIVGHRAHISEDREIILSLGFADAGGGVREKALGVFQRLSSHFQRALEIHHLFGRHMVKQTPEVQILDSLGFGVIFLDEFGRPGYYNQVAERISERGDGFRLSSAGLRARDAHSQNRLEALIRSCRAGIAHDDEPAGGWISIARDNSDPDYSVLVIPMPEVNDINLFSNPRILVLISDPAEGREDLGGPLKHLYGLTEGEIQVCLSLAAGKDTGNIADELGVSRDAVRFHLKNIFNKTHVKRQGELIRLLLTLPSVPGGSR
jgi:DNA-binding CsgD family transcriptional regulator